MVQITLWFTLGTIGMVVGTGMLAYGLYLVPEKRRRPFLLVVSVPAIAAVAYLLMALGIGGVETTEGTTVYIPRYVDWLITTPIHVAFIALLAGAGTGVIARAAVMQAATIVLGLIGALLAPPLNFVMWIVGSIVFAYVVYVLYVELEAYAVEQSDGIESLFRKLRAFVVILWLVYPAIWLLAPAGFDLMDIETASLVVSYIDVVAKVGFGLIALNDYVNLAEIGEVDAVVDEDVAPVGEGSATD